MLSRRLLQGVIYRTMVIKAGDKLPSATLTLNNPGEKADIKDLCKGKKTLIVGVVGAFTPTCDNQIPAFADKIEDLKKKGIDQVACITVNDPFVTSQWGKHLKTDGKVAMWADHSGAFAKAAGVENAGIADILGTVRSDRYMLLVDDDTVKHVSVETNPGEVKVTDPDTALSWL